MPRVTFFAPTTPPTRFGLTRRSPQGNLEAAVAQYHSVLDEDSLHTGARHGVRMLSAKLKPRRPSAPSKSASTASRAHISGGTLPDDDDSQRLPSSPASVASLRQWLAFPAVHDSELALNTSVDVLERRLDALLDPAFLFSPNTTSNSLDTYQARRQAPVGFGLSFATAGRSDAALRRKMARVYLKAMPSLAFVAPHLRSVCPGYGPACSRDGRCSCITGDPRAVEPVGTLRDPVALQFNDAAEASVAVPAAVPAAARATQAPSSTRAAQAAPSSGTGGIDPAFGFTLRPKLRPPCVGVARDFGAPPQVAAAVEIGTDASVTADDERLPFSRPLRVGFLFPNISTRDSLGQLLRNVVRYLSTPNAGPDELAAQVVAFVLRPPLADDDSDLDTPGSSSESLTQVLPEDNTLPALRSAIAAHRLDVLVFTDVSTSPTAYLLSLSRLARTQVLVMNNGVTSGSPFVDVFLSEAHHHRPVGWWHPASAGTSSMRTVFDRRVSHAGPAVAAAMYTEQLVLLPAPAQLSTFADTAPGTTLTRRVLDDLAAKLGGALQGSHFPGTSASHDVVLDGGGAGSTRKLNVHIGGREPITTVGTRNLRRQLGMPSNAVLYLCVTTVPLPLRPGRQAVPLCTALRLTLRTSCAACFIQPPASGAQVSPGNGPVPCPHCGTLAEMM